MARPISVSSIVKMRFTQDQLELGYRKAKSCPVSGHSSVREDGAVRDAHKPVDLYVGTMGELAGNLHFFTLEHFLEKRKQSEANKYKSDGGSDTLGYKIDYKARNCRSYSPVDFWFGVRPRERHAGNTYVHICIQTFDLSPEQLTFGNVKPIAYIIGWTTDDIVEERGLRFPDGPWGPRNGEEAAYVLKPYMLNNLRSFRVENVLSTAE